jgi:DNA-directed RNA polymerase specialized sigma24 family protein
MDSKAIFPSIEDIMLRKEQSFQELYTALRPRVTLFVYVYTIPSWNGQERDLIEDVLQETIVRIFCQVQYDTEKIVSIRSLESFCHTIARNYCLDLWRKDRRLCRSSDVPPVLSKHQASTSVENPAEIALTNLITSHVLFRAAELIAGFPEKQKTALLIDLALYNSFGDEPSTLQLALERVGIRLQDYQHRLPAQGVERTRHSSLLSQAYRRLRIAFHTPGDWVA